jgi:hypothetical protein
MVTVRDTIKRALRQIGVLSAGRDPKASESADALASLQGLYDHLAATETFGPLIDILTSGVYEAGENERVTGATSVTLPDTVTDACTGLERSPKDRSVVVVAGETPATHLYDADLAAWVDISALTLAASTPLGSRWAEGIAAQLALMVAGEFGATPNAMTIDTARRGKRAMTRKDPFRASPVALPLLCTSNLMNRGFRR